jgi:hypothetical protein
MEGDALRFSPDGNYFAVVTERGRLNVNCVEDAVRFYRTRNVKYYLEHSDTLQLPSPIWVVTRSTMKEGRIISHWRWLPNSSGVAFLERVSGGNQRLVLADLKKKAVRPLTSAIESVGTFDIRDGQHYVYTITDPADLEKTQAEHQAPAIVGTGRDLDELLFSDHLRSRSRRTYLWAVVGGNHFEVKHDGTPLVSYGDLALSPNGASLVTTLPVAEVPQSWETLYQPPFASYPHHIHVGHQDVQSEEGSVTSQYVRIILRSGSVQGLVDAPTSNDAGWWAAGSPSWSSDGQEILLPGTFIKSTANVPSRPCVAVVDLFSNMTTCVEILKGRTETGFEKGYHAVFSAHFAEGDKQRVMISFSNRDWSYGTIEYRHTADNTWKVAQQFNGVPEIGHDGLEVTVRQGLNEPPLLVAADKHTSKVVWDPNPQLKDIELEQASVYTWKDKEGQDWIGGLFKPSSYKPGRRYPLVIQTHGFTEFEFRPSGVFPTAFAARALAAVGIVVLQVKEHCPTVTPYEGTCVVSGYESAVNQLVSEGLVDPEKIGIIGFSRTCFYVMEALTMGSFHPKAASITDGVMETYLQYMTAVDWNGNAVVNEFDSMIGAPPFGDGLQQWLKRSPGFNLDKVTSPLLVVGISPWRSLFMWEPYAGLRCLHKPVDLMILNSTQHVLTNPAVRMASQGGTLDWFRFWLKDEEDPDPTKAEQYSRWRKLRKQQKENVNNLTTPHAISN